MTHEAPGVRFYDQMTTGGNRDMLVLSVSDEHAGVRQILHTTVDGLVALPPVRDADGSIMQPGKLRPDLDHDLEMAAWRDRTLGRGTETLSAAEQIIDSYQLAAGDSDPRHRDALDTIRTTAQRIAGRRYRPDDILM